MNDTELDEMLNQWGVPPVRAELRERVRSGYATKPNRDRRRFFAPVGWKGLFAGFATAAILFMFVITAAFPQSLGLFSGGFRIPYLVESEQIRYRADGSENVFHVTSFMHGADQFVLKVTNPGNPFMSMVQEIASPVHSFLLQVAPSTILRKQSSDDIARHRALVNNGCVRPGGSAIGQEKILGHVTTVVSGGGTQERVTQWMAPDLGCFTLRLIVETPQPDGSFRLSLKSYAVKVTVNP
jgi:hypothetical protein